MESIFFCLIILE